ncbi:MAG: enoyl-CoA hydratase/isomerase family protein [Candidatus Koribacter versatilis]|uniref:Enoyl-CoA hydratase/isomerase family protein n=1 Tax=Candidatus Korobacter versatilis TaxID=658062 RepID=A0A932A9J3_9BACT|nr:enoyl-CoA hydratase/isomerase family protein [Candidatus Koribacter versatilis]
MTETTSYEKVRLELNGPERTARITLNAPKANIVDRTMLAELLSAFDRCAQRDLCAVVLAAAGPHFSFGASVQEHLPEHIAETLSALHALIGRMVGMPAPVIAAVKGQCLGGGFELALACDLVLADETAVFGSPEIKLGVFAPAASALLPVRIGASRAAALLLTGENCSARDARAMGLVAAVAPAGGLDDLVGTYLETHFVPRSASGLRYAALAARCPVLHAVDYDLPRCEGMYLEELMATHDSVEGIQAFLEKREPRWYRNALAAVRD